MYCFSFLSPEVFGVREPVLAAAAPLQPSASRRSCGSQAGSRPVGAGNWAVGARLGAASLLPALTSSSAAGIELVPKAGSHRSSPLFCLTSRCRTGNALHRGAGVSEMLQPGSRRKGGELRGVRERVRMKPVPACVGAEERGSSWCRALTILEVGLKVRTLLGCIAAETAATFQ